MSFHYYKENIKAKKKKQCFLCGEMILVGDRKVKYVGVYEGDFYADSCHPECHAYHTTPCSATNGQEFEYGEAFPRTEAIEYVRLNNVIL